MLQNDDDKMIKFDDPINLLLFKDNFAKMNPAFKVLNFVRAACHPTSKMDLRKECKCPSDDNIR